MRREFAQLVVGKRGDVSPDSLGDLGVFLKGEPGLQAGTGYNLGDVRSNGHQRRNKISPSICRS